jgi:hypothetical protein
MAKYKFLIETGFVFFLDDNSGFCLSQCDVEFDIDLGQREPRVVRLFPEVGYSFLAVWTGKRLASLDGSTHTFKVERGMLNRDGKFRWYEDIEPSTIEIDTIKVKPATQVEVAEVEEQLQTWNRWQTFGEWPQDHSLWMDDKAAQVYVIYSGGETSFSPEGYRVVGARAYDYARDFIVAVYNGEETPAVALSQGVLRRAALPTIPEKWGEQWGYIKALRKLGRQTPRMDEGLSWTKVRWLGIHLALELGWNPTPTNS